MSIETIKNKILETKIFQNKKGIDYYLLFIIIFLMERGFFLINTLAISGYEDLILIIYLGFCIYCFLKYKNFRVNRYRFALPCLLVIVLIIVSSVVSDILYGQNFLMGIRAQRILLFCYMSYFPLSKYVCIDEKNKETLISVLYTTAWIELGVCITQYILSDVYMFTYVAKSVRYGGVRLQFDTNLDMFMHFFAMNNLLKGKDIKKNSIFIALSLFYNLFVLRARLLVIITIIVSLVAVLLWKKNIMLKLALILIGSLIFISLLFTPIMSSYLSVFDSNVRVSDGSYQLRVEGKAYYDKLLKKSPIVGRGYINILNAKAREASGYNKGYALNDNGVKGFQFQYGYIGLFWIVLLLGYAFYYGFKAYIQKGDYLGIQYATFLSGMLVNVVQFYWGWTPVYLMLTFALVEDNFVKFNLSERKQLEIREAV